MFQVPLVSFSRPEISKKSFLLRPHLNNTLQPRSARFYTLASVAEERIVEMGSSSHRMSKRLYVGGLPYSSTVDALKAAFEKAGAVESATIITDKMTGRSKGFGFVEMANDDDAQKAIEMWNGKDFEGRNLTVNEARPMGERPAGGGMGGGFGARRGFGSRRDN